MLKITQHVTAIDIVPSSFMTISILFFEFLVMQMFCVVLLIHYLNYLVFRFNISLANPVDRIKEFEFSQIEVKMNSSWLKKSQNGNFNIWLIFQHKTLLKSENIAIMLMLKIFFID